MVMLCFFLNYAHNSIAISITAATFNYGFIGLFFWISLPVLGPLNGIAGVRIFTVQIPFLSPTRHSQSTVGMFSFDTAYIKR